MPEGWYLKFCQPYSSLTVQKNITSTHRIFELAIIIHFTASLALQVLAFIILRYKLTKLKWDMKICLTAFIRETAEV